MLLVLYALTDSDIFIPDDVEEICDRCFYGLRHVKRLSFGDDASLKRIGVEAFMQSGLGPMVMLPDSIRDIDRRAFYRCLDLVSIGLWENEPSLESIGREAFSNCGISYVDIPSTVRTIGGSAFCGCRLSASSLGCDFNERYQILHDTMILESQTILVSTITEVRLVEIPDHVTEISPHCFANCELLA